MSKLLAMGWGPPPPESWLAQASAFGGNLTRAYLTLSTAKKLARERLEMTIPQEMADTIVDPKAYADGRIHDSYAWLRANDPLGVAHPAGYDPFRVVTPHADILEISRQNDLFHSGDRATTITNKEADDRIRKLTGGSPHLVRSLVQMDAPDHPKYRTLTQAWFLPRNIGGLDQRIRNIARASVDRMVAKNGDAISSAKSHSTIRCTSSWRF
jgi:cytochrome P450